MREGAEMKDDLIRIGIISDTHGLLRRAVAAQLQDCSCILHAGDIVRETDLDELRTYGNIYAVRGNCDTMPWASELRDVLRFTIGGVGFLMTHDRRNVPRDLTGVNVVICGHSHRYSEETVDGRLWLNPGSCGRARFGGEVTMAKMILRNGRMAVLRVDLEDSEA